jgi:Bacterial SH3 domain
MATPASNTPQPGLSPDPNLSAGRVVAVLLVVLSVGAVVLIASQIRSALGTPDSASSSSSALDARSLLGDSSTHFLPTPMVALRADAGAPTVAPEQPDASTVAAPPPPTQVKIANTGGAGAILRADPPRGRQITALREGTVLQVLERRQVDGNGEWLHVRTADGTEGWVFGSLTAEYT